MTRQITSHIVNPVNDLLTITADERSHGNASHTYIVSGHSPRDLVIHFQEGPIDEHGVNGLTQEVLLAILIDRLEGFQSGPYANVYNRQALLALQIAQEALRSRTLERMSRGVEGTHKV